MTKLEEYHERLLRCTGKDWCPYPSDVFIEACSQVDDEQFIKLVEQRRGYMAPAFFGREPMLAEIYKILNRSSNEKT